MSDSTLKSWVYFIQHGGAEGHIKIGTTSTNPYARMRSLQTGAPEALRLLAAFPGDSRVERELHDVFAAQRLRPDGEWFRCTPELRSFVEGVLWARRSEQPPQPEDDCEEDLDAATDGFHGLTHGQVGAIADLVRALILRDEMYGAYAALKHQFEAKRVAPWVLARAIAVRNDIQGWLTYQRSDAQEWPLSAYELENLSSELNEILTQIDAWPASKPVES